MKALCLKQPYASWVAEGRKTIETRTWRTKFRGQFLVVASSGRDLLVDLAATDNLDDPRPFEDYPFGKALATAILRDCRPMTKEDERAACCLLYDGAWAWLLSDVRQIAPFSVKGQRSFFEVPYGEYQPKLTEAA